MCGIAGSLDLRAGRPPEEDAVERMTEVLAHRGPDDAGLLVDGPVVLGHRRLSILDLSAAGHQPMSSRDGRLWITFNGEIYNYKELAAELRVLGHRFHTTCDTEVLLAAYQQWGADALRRLNGMFAFAVWDRVERELFCARDRFGVKPFYYTLIDGRFRFASEIKALLLDAPSEHRAPNDARVVDFLAYGFTDHTAETLFAGVLQLPPGGCLVAKHGRDVPSAKRWYTPGPALLDDTPRPAALRKRLTDAVAMRLRSDVPVGLALSGGLDSSSIAAIATELRGSEGLDPVETFSSRCADPRIDEGRYIESVSRMTGAPNQSFVPGDTDLVDNLDHVLWHMDEPFHSAAVFGHWRLSAFARAGGVTVLLDGQGGDEALAGYAHLLYPGLFFTALHGGRIDCAVGAAWFRRRVQGVSLIRSLKEAVKVMAPDRLRAPRLPAWVRQSDASPAPLPGRSLTGHQLYGLQVQPLPMYNHQLDRNTMAVALEARNPFLDYRVVELGLALRPEEHVHRGFTKWTLRQALRGSLPSDVLDRPRKQGFTTDEAEWMRGSLGTQMEETFRSSRFASRPYFDTRALLGTLEAHRRGGNTAAELWRAFAVERWLNIFVDPARLALPGRSDFSPRSARSCRDAVTRLEPLFPAESVA